MSCPNCRRPCEPTDLVVHDGDCDCCPGSDIGLSHCGCFYDDDPTGLVGCYLDSDRRVTAGRPPTPLTIGS